MSIRLFDLLGVDAATAAPLWPASLVSLSQANIDDRKALIDFLQQGIEFVNVRVGVDGGVPVAPSLAPGQITLSADMKILASGVVPPLFLHNLSDFAITLLPTDSAAPARCFFARDARGIEVVLEGVPVKVTLPAGLLEPADPTAQREAPNVPSAFDSGDLDGFANDVKTSPDGSDLYFKARFHLTPEGNLLFEPSIPISVKEAHLLGLPSTTLYDLNLIPSLRDKEPFEWARHSLTAFGADGGFAVRSIDFTDVTTQSPPFFFERARFVCEDVVFPFPSPLKIPLPLHGTFGIANGAPTGDIFALDREPVLILLHHSSTSNLWLTFAKLLFQTGDPPTVDLDAALIWEDTPGTTKGICIAVDDKFTVRAGFVLDDANPLHLITLAGMTVDFQGAKLGIGIGRLADHEPFKNSYEILFDFVLRKAPASSATAPVKPPLFSIKSLDGDDSPMVLRDVGWSFGRLHTPTLKSPSGFQILYRDKIALIVEEMGFLEEPDGTPYFSFSGGVELGFVSGKNPKDALLFKRLRFPLSHRLNAPPFKLDGLTLKLEFGKVKIGGFGFITESTTGLWRVNEWGFGVKIDFPAGKAQYSLGAVFLHGTRTLISDENTRVDYFLAGFELGYLPTGSVDLTDIHMLEARNLFPAITPGVDERLPLFNWYKQDRSRIRLPDDRALAQWKVEDPALSTAIGCSFALKGAQRFRAEILLFIALKDDDSGILAVGELYLTNNPDPLAWIAIEYEVEKGKLGVLVGLDLQLSKIFTGIAVPSWMDAALSGTLYFGNLPWTYEIGKLADQRTWLTLHVNYPFPIHIDFVVAFCAQVVDGGPKGFGVLFSFKRSTEAGIGVFRAYGTFGVVVAAWKTSSDTVSAIIWIDVGFSIKLFRVFRFGADISLRISYLGKHPWFTTLSARIEIKTPRFLPNVTFTFDRTWSEPRSFDQQTLRGSVHFSEGLGSFSGSLQRLASQPLIDGAGNVVDEQVLSFNEIAATTTSTVMPNDSDIPVLSTLSTIAIRFGHPMSNDMAVGPDSGNLGTQRVQDMTVRYALKSLAIRRRDRYGSAPQWKDFLTASQSSLDASGNSSVTFTPALSMRWQLDSRVDGKLHSDQLLLNGSTAYTFTLRDDQADEEALRDPLSAPCCGGSFGEQRSNDHVLAFNSFPAGFPLPRQQQFSNDGAWWLWHLRPAPRAEAEIRPNPFGGGPANFPGGPVTPGVPGLIQVLGAQIPPQPLGDMIIGTVDFADAVSSIVTEIAWSTREISTTAQNLVLVQLFLDALDDSGVVGTRAINLNVSGGGDQTITIAAPPSKTITHFVIRMHVQPWRATAQRAAVLSPPPPNTVPQVTAAQIVRISYVTAEEAVRAQGVKTRCRNIGGATGGAGKLAWLPNQLYEIAVTSEIRMSSATEGARATQKTQTSYFFTNALPGFNRVETTGDELRPLVESVYPPNLASPLYRDEPAAVAFTELMSTILPVPRAAGPNDPEETTQKVDLMLNLDRIGSTDGLRRVTFPSHEWFDAQGAGSRAQAIFSFGFIPTAVVRSAATQDPGRLRFERLMASSPQCAKIDLLHNSQVLLQPSVLADGTSGPWDPQTTYRATVRLSAGPYAHRDVFDDGDLSAFAFHAESGASATNWTTANGALLGTLDPGRSYALFGDAAWMHLQAEVRLDPGTTSAGFALGVSSDLSQAIVALVSTVASGDRVLTLERRAGGTVVGMAPITLTVPAGAVTLRVIGFDDKVQAAVGETSIEIDRASVRAGQVALVSEQGNAQFLSVNVDALDLFNFDFATSRYRTFEEHIGSFDGSPRVWDSSAIGAAPSVQVANWLAAHRADINAVMQPAADPQRRQALFTAFTMSQIVPLQERVDRLTITCIENAGILAALLIESPEPLPCSRDVKIAASNTRIFFNERRVGIPPPPPNETPLPTVVLTNGAETAAVILPDPASPSDPPFGSGGLMLDFAMTRSRWRADASTAADAIKLGRLKIGLGR
jgi:hypothetical protein